jgi:hypothetical protein
MATVCVKLIESPEELSKIKKEEEEGTNNDEPIKIAIKETDGKYTVKNSRDVENFVENSMYVQMPGPNVARDANLSSRAAGRDELGRPGAGELGAGELGEEKPVDPNAAEEKESKEEEFDRKWERIKREEESDFIRYNELHNKEKLSPDEQTELVRIQRENTTFVPPVATAAPAPAPAPASQGVLDIENLSETELKNKLSETELKNKSDELKTQSKELRQKLKDPDLLSEGDLENMRKKQAAISNDFVKVANVLADIKTERDTTKRDATKDKIKPSAAGDGPNREEIENSIQELEDKIAGLQSDYEVLNESLKKKNNPDKIEEINETIKDIEKQMEELHKEIGKKQGLIGQLPTKKNTGAATNTIDNTYLSNMQNIVNIQRKRNRGGKSSRKGRKYTRKGRKSSKNGGKTAKRGRKGKGSRRSKK